MTEEDFWNYGPLLNHFRIGVAIYNQFYTDLNDRMFETYGEEFDFVENHDPSNIWTMTEEDGVLSLSSGKLTVNRVGYFVTEVPWQENISIVLQ